MTVAGLRYPLSRGIRVAGSIFSGLKSAPVDVGLLSVA